MPFICDPQVILCSLHGESCTLFASYYAGDFMLMVFLVLLSYLCCLLMSRAHPNPEVAEEVMRLHAFLLICPATRSAATQLTIQQILHTVQHLSLEVPMTSKSTDITGTAALGTVRGTDNDNESGSGGDTGLHDQLSSISTCVAAVDEAVSSHHDASVCLAIWRQAVHLAPPTGMM